MTSSDSEFDVICYGTISADNIVYVPYVPTPRRDSQVQAEFSRLGGEAATVARVLSTWGLRVAIVGNILGEDRWGNFIRQELASYSGIDTRYVTSRPDVRSPFCRIMVTPDGERSILGYWFDDTPKTRLDEELMSKARLLSVDVYGQTERDDAARLARALGRTVVSADAIWPNYPLAGLSDIIVISRDFLTSYFPGIYIYDHALELQQAGAGSVVVTHGQKPVLVVDEHGRPSHRRTVPGARGRHHRRGRCFQGGGDLRPPARLGSGARHPFRLRGVCALRRPAARRGRRAAVGTGAPARGKLNVPTCRPSQTNYPIAGSGG